MGSVDGLLEIRNQIPVSGLSACQSAGAYWIPQKFPSSSKANPSRHEPLILIELNDIDHTSGGFPLGLTRAPRSSGRGAVIPQPYAFTNAVVQPLRTENCCNGTETCNRKRRSLQRDPNWTILAGPIHDAIYRRCVTSEQCIHGFDDRRFLSWVLVHRNRTRMLLPARRRKFGVLVVKLLGRIHLPVSFG